MPAPDETPGTAAATRNSAGTSAAQPAPTSAKPINAGTGERVASASTTPATVSAPPRRASLATPHRAASGSPASRATAIAIANATTPPAATAALARAGPARKTALQFIVADSTNIEQNVSSAGSASAPRGNAKWAVPVAASSTPGSSRGTRRNATTTTQSAVIGN